MISILQPLLAISVPCLSIMSAAVTRNLSASTEQHINAVLASLPYASLPMGLAGLAAAHAAKTMTHLVGCGSGCLLGQFVFCILASGVSAAQFGGNTPCVVAVLVSVTLVMLVATVLGWSYTCSYPKFLRRIWTNAKAAGRSEKPCQNCGAAECSGASSTVGGFTDLCLTCGETGPVTTSEDGDQQAAAAQARELVVTYPVMAFLITLASVFFSVAVLGAFAYTVYLQFKIGGPLWQALLPSVAESPFFLAPLCMVPRLRDAFISIYATGPDNSRSDLHTRLLASEFV